jgi:hypothetical protein
VKDITIRQGETLRQTVTVDEEGAVSATFVATDGVTNVIEETANFSGLTADITVLNTIVPTGTYEYYVSILWDDDTVDYLPDSSACSDDECELPELTICAVPGVS